MDRINPASNRAACAPGGEFLCWAGGQRIAPQRLKVRTMNFDQHWRTSGIVELEYRVGLPRGYVRARLAGDYEEYVEECRRSPDDANALDAALAKGGFPSLDEALAAPDIALPLLDFYRVELLQGWVGGGPTDALPYVLNTVDRWNAEDGVYWAEGKCRPPAAGLTYQDL